MKVATLEKFHLREGNQDPGDPGVGKVRGGGFFFLQAGGELTLDDTMPMFSTPVGNPGHNTEIYLSHQAISNIL